MKRWLESITPDRHSLEKLWCMRPFAALGAHRGCWTFNRGSVTRAFAVGLFIAFIPPTPLPVHLLTCTILGISFGLNLPVLFATVFLSNPFTWVPQVLASIWVGAKLTGMDLAPMVHDMSRRTLFAHLHALWPPLLIGALVLGLAAAAAGYVLAQCAWRLRVALHLRRRRQRRLAGSGHGSALDQRSVR